MKLNSLHILLTYQCNLACDHCFVFGSPWQSGTLTWRKLEDILDQAHALGTVESIYFEGGEPFLYYALLVKGVERAAGLGFQVGIVSNAYWATDVPDAIEWLRPFAGRLSDLSISSDLYHWSAEQSRWAENACAAAEELGIPIGVISVAQPEAVNAAPAVGQLPPGVSAVMYRGRAAQELVGRATLRPWSEFTTCPHEDLREPGRVHLDPLGNLHVCQGIVLGNVFQTPLKEICAGYRPDQHPIAGPLLRGGPVALVNEYGVSPSAQYADACHLCYQTRRALRPQFPDLLKPDQVYGII
ncbi:MAG: radical SAM protein [Chloroflexota bacterium]